MASQLLQQVMATHTLRTPCNFNVRPCKANSYEQIAHRYANHERSALQLKQDGVVQVDLLVQLGVRKG